MARSPMDSLAKLAAHPRLRLTIPLACLLALVVVASLWLGFPTRRDLTIVVDGKALEVRTTRATVGEALRAAGVTVGSRDLVTPDPSQAVTGGMEVVVRHAVPIILSLDGREIRLMTAAATVGEAIRESRLSVGPDDRLLPRADQPVVNGLRISVTRVIKSYQHRLDEIPFKVIRREDTTLDIGQSRIAQKGQVGLESRLLMVTYEDAKEVDASQLRSEVVRQPTPQIIRVGTAGTILVGGKAVRFLKSLNVRATAYEPGPISCGASADGLTCLGLRATKGIVAVDPRVIPFWSKLYVEGYGYAVAGDSGSAIKGHRIDVCYDTYPEAMRWGVRNVKVYILELPAA